MNYFNPAKHANYIQKDLESRRAALRHIVTIYGFLLPHGKTTFSEFARKVAEYSENPRCKAVSSILEETPAATVQKSHFSIIFEY